MSCYHLNSITFYCPALPPPTPPCCRTFSTPPCLFPYPKSSPLTTTKNTENRSILKKSAQPMDSYEANRVCPSLIGRCPFKRMISRGLIDSAICVCMPPNRTPWYLTLDEEALQLLREEQDKDFKHWLHHYKPLCNSDWRSLLPTSEMSCTSVTKPEARTNPSEEQHQPMVLSDRGLSFYPMQQNLRAGDVDTKKFHSLA